MAAKGVKKSRLTKMEEDFHQEISSDTLFTMLDRAGLPRDYPDLTPQSQREARLSSLTSWFKHSGNGIPIRPHVLCDNPKAFVRAFYLWTEYYLKPASCNEGVYYFKDPENKYDMVRHVMSPALESGKPARSIVKATRRMGKTQTIAVDAMPMISIIRPYSLCLLSELNEERTGEELDKMREQIEENDRIHSDFGADGVLFPRRSGVKKWNSHRLDLLHYPKCAIMGHSLKSAQRGRGPIYGVVDDPEDEDLVQNVEWRRWLFDRLLNVYSRMFTFGGVLCWVGTPVDERSCLAIAYRGQVVDDEREDQTKRDHRLDGWRKGNFSIIQKTKDGKSWRALQPDRYSLEDFLKDLATDPISAMKEVLCEPATPGMRAFKRHHQYHGFMFARDSKGVQWYLDLNTGYRRPLREFLDEIRVFGAGDPADGQSADADPGALVFIGIDSRGVKHVLDCYNAICFVEKLIEMAYVLAEEWDCERLGWESAALQTIIIRIAERHVEKLRSEGKAPPVLDKIQNAKKDKVRRILAMTPLFSKEEIRFRRMESIVIKETGEIYEPLEYSREPMYVELLAQIDEFTDQGLRRHDDLIDALEMALRLAFRQVAAVQELDEDPVEVGLAKWEKVGVHFQPEQIPREVWNERILKELAQRQQVFEEIGDVIPYV